MFNTIKEMQLEVFRQINTFEASFLTMLLSFKHKIRLITLILGITDFSIFIFKIIFIFRDPYDYNIITKIPIVTLILILIMAINIYNTYAYLPKMANQYIESKINIVYAIMHKYDKCDSLSEEEIKEIIESDLYPYAKINLEEDIKE